MDKIPISWEYSLHNYANSMALPGAYEHINIVNLSTWIFLRIHTAFVDNFLVKPWFQPKRGQEGGLLTNGPFCSMLHLQCVGFCECLLDGQTDM
jgi:hypothetical protein